MLTKYIEAAMKRAHYEVMEDGDFFATVPGLKGLWASASTRVECERELRDTLEGWLIVMLRRDQVLPAMGRVSLGPALSKTA
jgi:predicted RNase H-like HicB family nuclease